MKKKAFQRALSLVLTIVMFVGLIPTMAFAAEEDPFTVVVSMEGNTLGQVSAFLSESAGQYPFPFVPGQILTNRNRHPYPH